jgi:ribosomal protein S12 methylthiotransferase RimO
MYNVGLISLGCVKNTVDSEAILAMLKQEDFNITTDLNNCDLIMINTCGFILDAKVEAINVILKALEYKKKTIVLGCLVERYEKELRAEFPEVDAFVSLDEYDKLPDIIDKLMNDKVVERKFDIFNRVLSTPSYMAYLKISEGCDNFCAFCAIPFIRGRFHSFKMDELVNYAKDLAKMGVKELVVISQDTVSYGKDLKDGSNLYKLLKELDQIDGLEFIRVLYTYPQGINDDLLHLIANSKKITHYFDIPLQHCNTRVLKSMNRHDTKETIVDLYKRIKAIVPDATLRTTLIAGFPGETDEEAKELLDFIKDIRFNHVGVFTFSKEEGTKAALLKGQIDDETKAKRKDALMVEQKHISYELNKAMIGNIYKAIVTKVLPNNEYEVRSTFNSPDDIDGSVILQNAKVHKEGDLIKIKITHAFVYDLICEEV